jgi:hypothetical protein
MIQSLHLLLTAWQQIAFFFRRILLHHLWPVSQCRFLRSYLISVYIYEKLCLTYRALLFFPKHLPHGFRIQCNSQRDIIIRHCGLHVKTSSFLYDFKQTWIFYTDFPTIPQYKFSQKSVLRELSSSLLSVGHTCRS